MEYNVCKKKKFVFDPTNNNHGAYMVNINNYQFGWKHKDNYTYAYDENTK